VIHLWIDGQPPRKSNSRRIVQNKERTRVIKSQKALDWTASALSQIPDDAKQGVGSADDPLCITMDIWYESRRPDLSGELVLDMLQKAGVISDDRNVYVLHLYKHFDKNAPGVSIQIEQVSEQD